MNPEVAQEQTPDTKRLLDSLRTVVIWPDPILTRVCVPVPTDRINALQESSPTPQNSALRGLMDEMATTMRLAGGGGLAAPQVGSNLRIVCLKVQHRKDGEESVTEEIVHLINPVISMLSSETAAAKEGCLSLPGVLVVTNRPSFCRVTAFGYDGRPLELGGDGLLAVALQHEIDHLDGKLLVDRLSPLKRDVLKRRLTKQKARGLRYNLTEKTQ